MFRISLCSNQSHGDNLYAGYICTHVAISEMVYASLCGNCARICDNCSCTENVCMCSN